MCVCVCEMVVWFVSVFWMVGVLNQMKSMFICHLHNHTQSNVQWNSFYTPETNHVEEIE